MMGSLSLIGFPFSISTGLSSEDLSFFFPIEIGAWLGLHNRFLVFGEECSPLLHVPTSCNESFCTEKPLFAPSCGTCAYCSPYMILPAVISFIYWKFSSVFFCEFKNCNLSISYTSIFPVYVCL